jgi:hypothetical protein
MLHIGHREPKRDDADLARVESYLRQLLSESLRRDGRAAETCVGQIPFEGTTVKL